MPTFSVVLLLQLQRSEQQLRQPQHARGIVWATARAWLSPPRHLFVASTIASATATSALVTLTAQLAAPQLAFLGDCRAHSRPVVPASAWSEMIAAACSSLGLSSALDDGRLVLVEAVLRSPLDPEAAAAALYHVNCHLDMAAGLAEVVSSAARTAGGTRHLSAVLRIASYADSQAATVAARPGISLRVRMQVLSAVAAAVTASPALLASVTPPAHQLDATGFVVSPAAAEAGHSLSAVVPTQQHSPGVHRLGELAQWAACLPRPRQDNHERASSMQVVCVRMPPASAGTSMLKVPIEQLAFHACHDMQQGGMMRSKDARHYVEEARLILVERRSTGLADGRAAAEACRHLNACRGRHRNHSRATAGSHSRIWSAAVPGPPANYGTRVTR